uniref:Putative YopX protein n=2 Tax=viral metagenome TaxID=1070528 RepID=A0A6M3LNN1_9ZZZZ
MREIKFRAYHKTQKQMFYSFYLDFRGKIGVWNHEETEIIFGDYPFLELMQYTGLHDKNGKEVFEGDIVRLSNVNDDGDEGKTCVAVMRGFEATFDEIPDGWYYPMGSTAQAHREVIGNIYENQELLEAKE